MALVCEMGQARKQHPGIRSLTLYDNFDTVSYEPQPSERLLRFANGDYYQGETLADLRHGTGKHVCSNGDIHEGGWYKGTRHGRGKASFIRGFFYEGDFQYDRAHGSGKAKYENGSIYDGEFANDQRCGWGVQIFPDESVYEGEWGDDTMQGSGRLTLKDGSYYEGNWEGGQCKHGVWRSQDRHQEYSGEWVDGRKQGQGVLIVDGMFHYTGAWQDDVQEGYGKCRWIDGSVYDGMWKNGKRHGKGKIVRADGCKYDGQWEDDKQHGQGNARLDNGDRYHGEFKDGQPNGEGRSRTSDGDRYDGEWKDGKKHGRGRCLFTNGDRYQGEWAFDKRHGQGVCHFSNGNVFRGEWQEDHWVQSEAEPSLCRVAGFGLSQCVAGEETSFSILARDNLGNKRLSGGDNFVVWLEGPATVHARVKDQDDGSFLATYTAYKAGMYNLYITNETGESVAEAPYPMRTFPAEPQPIISIIRLPKNIYAQVSTGCHFLVELHDQYDNRCVGADAQEEMPIEAEIYCGSTNCDVKIESSRSGKFQCSFVPPIEGYYRVNVSSIGQQLKNSPLSIQVHSLGGDSKEPSNQVVQDEGREWERRAAQQYKEDGNTDGWETDDSQPETAEQKYRREHPDVPVVENLEDMWKVTKLQRERKKTEEKARALAEMAQLQNSQTPPEEKHPQRAPLIGKNLRNQSPRNGEPQEENQQQKGNEEEKGEIGDGADSSQIESPKALPSSNQSPPQDASQDSGQKGGSNGENYSGVDSIYPEKSVFNQSAYSRRSTDRHPKSRRSTDRHPKSNYIEVDKAGFITQLSEISDVSSLSSKMTHLGTDGLMESLSSGEAVQFSPRNRP